MTAGSAVALAGANADLLAVHGLGVGTHALLAIGAVQGDLAGVDSALGVHDTASLTLPAGLDVLVNDVRALDEDLALLRGRSDDLALNALVVSAQNDDGIALFEMPPYSTSGASDRILR